jgi:hypothetical protein
MYPVTAVFAAALREAHTMVARVDAWYNGSMLASDLPIGGGEVRVNSGTGVRRQLDLTITDDSLWSELDVIGVELRPYRGIRYPSGDEELVPLGVFSLDSQSMSVAPGGGISVRSAPDRWARVQRARFETPASSNVGALVSAEAARLISAAVPEATVTTAATSTVAVGSLVWDRDRDRAIVDLLTSISAEAYVDHAGNVIIRDAPLLSQTPVWTVDASPSGVLLDGELRRDRSRTYNVVVVTDSRTDGSAPFAPQVAADTDPTSRTYVGGPFGRVPYYWSSPTVTTDGQAYAAAVTILNRVKALNAQLDVTAVVHPGLDRGDVITVLTTSGQSELHLVDSCGIPLTVRGTQPITTRSSRPDGDVPGGE